MVTTAAPIKKVVLFGPESTGKTTLSLQLASHFNTVCAPEFARHYLDTKRAFYDPFGRKGDEICQPQDIPHIVIGQIATEDALLSQANTVLLCDTNPLQTKVYNFHYFGRHEEWLDEIVKSRPYDFYLLMDVDVPWVPDQYRDRPTMRKEMFDAFEGVLQRWKFPYALIRGDFDERFSSSVKEIEKVISI